MISSKLLNMLRLKIRFLKNFKHILTLKYVTHVNNATNKKKRKRFLIKYLRDHYNLINLLSMIRKVHQSLRNQYHQLKMQTRLLIRTLIDKAHSQTKFLLD